MDELVARSRQAERTGAFIESVAELASGNAGSETVYVGDDATQPVHYALSAFPIEMDGITTTGVLMRDVTEQWELEQMQYRFVSIAAHELRTPLTSVMGFSELLQTRQPSDEQRQKWTGYINAEAHRLTAILDQILNVAKIKSGEADALQLETMDVADVIGEVVHESSGQAATHVWAKRVEGDIPVVITDVGKVKQVLHALLTNAITYSPEGSSIVVAARTEPLQSKIVIDVIDEGPGIAERDWPRLFASFSRVPRPGEEGVRGAGLGLFISRKLARSWGGDVWLQASEPGVGSTFSFSIPLDAHSVPAEAA